MISVIVPVYNAKETVEECVRSILAQTWKDLEVVLVDDGSEDGSGEICDRLAGEDARVRVLHQEHKGHAMARNAGMDASKGNLLGFLNAEDTADPAMYRKMLSALLDSYADICVCGTLVKSGKDSRKDEGNTLKEDKVTVRSGREALSDLFEEEKYDVSSCNRLFRRELFEGIRFPGEKYFEDMHVMDLLYTKAGKVCMIDAPLYHCGNDRGPLVSYRDNVRPWLDRIMVLDRQYCRYGNDPKLQAYLCETAIRTIMMVKRILKKGGYDELYTKKILHLMDRFYDDHTCIEKNRVSKEVRMAGFLFRHAPSLGIRAYDIYRRKS